MGSRGQAGLRYLLQRGEGLTSIGVIGKDCYQPRVLKPGSIHPQGFIKELRGCLGGPDGCVTSGKGGGASSDDLGHL